MQKRDALYEDGKVPDRMSSKQKLQAISNSVTGHYQKKIESLRSGKKLASGRVSSTLSV